MGKVASRLVFYYLHALSLLAYSRWNNDHKSYERGENENDNNNVVDNKSVNLLQFYSYDDVDVMRTGKKRRERKFSFKLRPADNSFHTQSSFSSF